MMDFFRRSQATCRLLTVRASLCVCPARRPARPPGEPGTPASAATGIATPAAPSLEAKCVILQVLSAAQTVLRNQSEAPGGAVGGGLTTMSCLQR